MSPSSAMTRPAYSAYGVDKIGIGVVQFPPHLVGVLLVNAEDNRFAEAVRLLQETP